MRHVFTSSGVSPPPRGTSLRARYVGCAIVGVAKGATMPTNAWIGALVGAAIGAAAWAAISYFTGYEVGYVAWGIGGAVGGLASMGGSRGGTAGAICAVLALVAIVVGKWVAADRVVARELDKQADEWVSPRVHAELIEDVKVFDTLTSEEQYPQFMVDRGFSDVASGADVTPDEVARFKQHDIPMMEEFRGTPPPYATWAPKQRAKYREMVMSEVSMIDVVKEGLGPIDLLFGLLGVATAFQLAKGS